jgi:hypothetical protein
MALGFDGSSDTRQRLGGRGKSKPEALRQNVVAGRLAQQCGQQTLSTCAERVRRQRADDGQVWHVVLLALVLAVSTDDASVIALRRGP